MPKLPFIAPVNGISYRQQAAALVLEGDPVTCEHDPANPHDPNAIVVRNADGNALGYLPKSLARQLVHQYGTGCSFPAIVEELFKRETLGLRIKLLATPTPTTTPAPEQIVGVDVTAKSGRHLGTLVELDGDEVVVQDNGDLARYPRTLVSIAGELAIDA